MHLDWKFRAFRFVSFPANQLIITATQRGFRRAARRWPLQFSALRWLRQQ